MKKMKFRWFGFISLMLSRTYIDLNGWRQVSEACSPLKSSGLKLEHKWLDSQMRKGYISQSLTSYISLFQSLRPIHPVEEVLHRDPTFEVIIHPQNSDQLSSKLSDISIQKFICNCTRIWHLPALTWKQDVVTIKWTVFCLSSLLATKHNLKNRSSWRRNWHYK